MTMIIKTRTHFLYIFFPLLVCLALFHSPANGTEEETEQAFSSVEERRVFALMENERQELQRERQDLDLRKNELKTLEVSVDNKIKEIDEKLEDLKSLQRKIEKLLAEKSNREKERIENLSAIYEKMIPARAALAISRMEPVLATDILANMKPKAAARILDQLDKQKTSQLSNTFTTLQLE